MKRDIPLTMEVNLSDLTYETIQHSLIMLLMFLMADREKMKLKDWTLLRLSKKIFIK